MNAKQANRAERRRRMVGDRDERRKKAAAILQPMTQEQRIAKLEKALEEERIAGFEFGRDGSIGYTFKAIYAAIMLASKELYGFDGKQAKKLLNRVDAIVAVTLTE